MEGKGRTSWKERVEVAYPSSAKRTTKKGTANKTKTKLPLLLEEERNDERLWLWARTLGQDFG